MATRLTKLRAFLESEADQFQFLADATANPEIRWAYNRAVVNATKLLDDLDNKINIKEYTEEKVYRCITYEWIIALNQIFVDVYNKYQERNMEIPYWAKRHIQSIVEGHKAYAEKELAQEFPLDEKITVVKPQELELKESISNIEVVVAAPEVQEPEENSIIEYKPEPIVYESPSIVKIKEEKEMPVCNILLYAGNGILQLMSGTVLGFSLSMFMILAGVELSGSAILGISIGTGVISASLSMMVFIKEMEKTIL